MHRFLMRNRLILICLLFSGFAGLAFELMWTRLLSFSFGSTTLSFSTVLAVFFGGLALGAFLSGRRAARFVRPLRVYGFIEVSCGVAGLLLYPVLKNLGGLFASLDPGAGPSGMLLRLVFSAPLLLIPTVLMGATLPAVTAAVIHKDEEIGRGTALIYGLNTLGACLGAYLATYHLLPAFGVFGTNTIAACANFIAGAGALLIDRTASPSVQERALSEARTDESREKKWIAAAAIMTAIGGYAAISLQIVWVRIFTSILDGTIYGVGAVLISVLVGIALGSIFIAPTVKSAKYSIFWFIGLQLATVLSTLWFCQNIDWIEYHLRFFGLSRGQPEKYLHTQLFGTFLVLAIPTLASGASFPLLIQSVERSAQKTGRSLGFLYAANTVGSILGCVLTGFVVVPFAGSEAAVGLAMALLGLSALIAALSLGPPQQRTFRLLAAAVTLLAVAVYQGFDVRGLAGPKQTRLSTFDEWKKTREIRDEEVLFFAEGEHANVVVIERESTPGLFLNGLPQGTRMAAPPHFVLESVLVAYVPLVHARALDKAMIVGLGAGATMELMSHWGIKHLKVVELEKEVVEAVRKIYEPEDPYRASGLEVVVNDARHQLLLEKNAGGGNYDIITSMPAHPWVAASIFTQEFFELARANLGKSGVFCTWIGTGKMDELALQSIVRGFVEVFPNYLVYFVPSTGAYFLVGGMDRLQLDLDRLDALQNDPLIQGHAYFDKPLALLLDAYAGGGAADRPRPGVINTDDSAFAETHGPRSSTRAAMLGDLLPQRLLPVEFLPEAQRSRAAEALLESLLGTPGGQISNSGAALRVAQAKRTLTAAKSVLDDGGEAYFLGRIATSEGRSAEAHAHFDRVSSGPFAARAKKFRALVEQNREQRLEQLSVLPATTDVLVLLLDLDRSRSLALVGEEPPQAEVDPIRWLLWMAKEKRALDAGVVRSTFQRNLGRPLRETASTALLELAADVTESWGMVEETVFIEARRHELAAQSAQRFVQRAMRAGATERYAEAARFFAAAEALQPGKREAQILRARTLVELGDRQALAEQLDRLRFHGVSEGYLSWLLQDAETRRVGARFPTENSGESLEREDVIQSDDEQ
jgi:spermidine synthase